jgi:hypothetical protein
MRIISVNFDLIKQVLLRYFAFIMYWRKMGVWWNSTPAYDSVRKTVLKYTIVKLWLLGMNHVEYWELSNVSANIGVAILRVICIGWLVVVVLCRALSGLALKVMELISGAEELAAIQ